MSSTSEPEVCPWAGSGGAGSERRPGPAAAISPGPARGGMFFNPRDPEFNKNPYPHYRRLREEDPVHRSPWGVWFVGKYEHVRGILRDPRFRVQDVPGQLRKRNAALAGQRMVGPADHVEALAHQLHQLELAQVAARSHGHVHGARAQQVQPGLRQDVEQFHGLGNLVSLEVADPVPGEPRRRQGSPLGRRLDAVLADVGDAGLQERRVERGRRRLRSQGL